MPAKVITADSQRRAAQIFNQISCAVIVLFPLIFIWLCASIFVYASIAHHPNPRVVDYLRPAGHRFYGITGFLVVILNFSSPMAKWVGGMLHLAILIWIICLLVILPLGIRDILRAGKENWQDLTINEEGSNA
jgi:hypothetical protein